MFKRRKFEKEQGIVELEFHTQVESRFETGER